MLRRDVAYNAINPAGLTKRDRSCVQCAMPRTLSLFVHREKASAAKREPSYTEGGVAVLIGACSRATHIRDCDESDDDQKWSDEFHVPSPKPPYRGNLRQERDGREKNLVPGEGFEPPTNGLQNSWLSTNSRVTSHFLGCQVPIRYFILQPMPVGIRFSKSVA